MGHDQDRRAAVVGGRVIEDIAWSYPDPPPESLPLKGFLSFDLGRADVVAGLARLKSYLDYGQFQPLQIAATVALREARERPAEVAEIYGGRRDAPDGDAG